MSLKDRLDALYVAFNCVDSATDPIQVVRRFTNPADREIVGFCAAALAFGRVASVLQSVERLVAVMGPSPAAFVRAFDVRRDAPALKPIVHRWTKGEDVTALVIILQQMLSRGSIETFFLDGYDAGAPDLSGALESFSNRALATDLRPAYGSRTPRPGVAYFFSRPSSGGACKRLNLFLRWMVRHDAVDFGLWKNVPAAKLIVPLDTHVIRVGRCLRLTSYTSPGWRMAADITASLRELDPIDPVKYDFSLCHLGMADQCGFNRAQSDSCCPLRGLCRPRLRGGRPRARGTPRSSARPSAPR
ncbi:MAG TPA: TIGR02757 family protein [Vicinamibacterales bacterium]|nr:TIGR02757 family protein [Vicinamibacterales bacterium]